MISIRKISNNCASVKSNRILKIRFDLKFQIFAQH